MALTIKGRPVRFSLKWLRPPPTPADGSMSLYEHLAELRYRLVLAAVSIAVATIVCFIFREQLTNILTNPYNRAIALAKEARPDLDTTLVINGAVTPFTVSLKIAALAGLIVSCPIWLYQIWVFIVPGLLAREKKWSLIIVGVASPLFGAGVVLAYYVMPKAVAILLSFTPEGGITNLQDLGEFLSFMTRIMIVFGLAFEVPLFIVMLNIVGVLPARMISKYRSYIIFALFVFAALATPTPDATTMLLLAIPMVLLVVLAEVIAHLLDRRKARRSAGAGTDVVFAESVSEDKALRSLSADDDEAVARAEPVERAEPETSPERPTAAQWLGLSGQHDHKDPDLADPDGAGDDRDGRND